MFIDDSLGNHRHRYFGAGHKNTEYELFNKSLKESSGSFTKNAKISHTEGWSEKKGQQITPHLTTIDSVILAALLSENYLSHHYPNINVSSLYLAAFELRAGTQPIESLEKVPLSLETATIEPEDLRFGVSMVGTKVKLRFRPFPDYCNNFRGPATESVPYISNHLKKVTHLVKEIEVPPNQETIAWEVTDKKVEETFFDGIGSNFSDGMSLLEWLIIFSQIGQILIYNFEETTREDSETLWMRRIKAESDSPQPFPTDGMAAAMEISKTLLLSRGEEQWRPFEMKGFTQDQNIQFESKVAHKVAQPATEGGAVHG